MSNMINQAIQESLIAGLEAGGVNDEKIVARLVEIFSADLPFLGKVANFDQFVDSNSELEFFREVFFDLLILNFFSEDTENLKEDYFESEEWEEVEEKTLDRGTELLNILLYISECRDENIEPELSDFLKEFLLTDESEFQDEHSIYEVVIANQLLMESDFREIAKVAENIEEEDELASIFYGLMSFFLIPKPDQKDKENFKASAPDQPFDNVVYEILATYLKAL
ncbi:MAG TPA: hypothetical protein VK102_08650 [Sphingobacterium sp.]|nr:hypothetical protein [Sphingobacterium sp.]